MTYDDGTVKMEQENGVVDLDFQHSPEALWIGIWGVDLHVRRVPGEDGDPDTLVVEVWEPGVVSSPVAELAATLGEGKGEQ